MASAPSSNLPAILIIVYEYPPVGGGAGKNAARMAAALARRGHDVTILTSGFGNLPPAERHGAVRVLRIPVLRRQINYAAAWEVLSFAGSGMLRARRLARELRPGLILSYFTIPGGPVAWAIGGASGAPFITLLRGQDVPGYPDTGRLLSILMRPAVRWIWHRSRRVIANSQGLAELARRVMPGLHVPVVENAVDTDIYCPDSTNHAPDRPFSILFVGRLREFKGIHDLIDAFARARPTLDPGARLRIAGHGPWRERLERRAAGLGLGTAVQFLGRIEEPEVIAELRAADVVANPSYGEGMPNSVLEAMACGAALLLSDIGPHREMADPGVEALFAAPHDAEALAARLIELAGDAGLRRWLGEAARRRVIRDFSFDAKAETLMRLIEEPRQNP